MLYALRFKLYLCPLESNRSCVTRSLTHVSPINRNLLVDLEERHEVKNLIRFSQRYYTVEQHEDTILFNDLRFGQITGWHDPKQRFAFSYYLRPEKMDNTLVVQRGRFANCWRGR